MVLKGLVLSCLFLTLASHPPNPFLIDIGDTSELTIDDFFNVQNKLHAIDVEGVVDLLYSEIESRYIPWDNFYFRCSRGAKQTLILPEKAPTTHLKKIGVGGNRCIVCHISLDREYPSLLSSLPDALEKTGFNGYFYYRIGGFPNPTGKEIQYAGVPYSFKIYAMMEAHHLGFTNVLWIDASMLPLTDPSPLFEIIESSGAFFFEEAQDRHLYYIFPRTRALLQEVTGVDVWEVPSVRAMAFGLNMEHPLTKDFLKIYNDMVALGWPFVSAYPEEFVFSAILNQSEFKPFQANMKGGMFNWKTLESRYNKQFSWGPDWLICHYNPAPGDVPAFFYFRPHL